MPLGIATVTLLLAGAADASTLKPPVLPLTVRNPYLSTWLGNARDEPWQKWPMFWTGTEIGFGVLAHLPDTNDVFPLLGRPHDSLPSDTDDNKILFPMYKGAKYDASTTNLSYVLPPLGDNEGINVTLSFLSPVTPTSTLRQSLPATYFTVHVEGNVDVNIYVDVNGQWVSGHRESVIQWDLQYQTAGPQKTYLKTWEVKRQSEQVFSEEKDQAEWGKLHFTAPEDVRHECGNSSQLRLRFARTGSLQNELDSKFRAIMDDEPVFAFSKSFELSQSNSTEGSSRDSIMFTIAHIQDPITQFASARGLTYMRPLWKSWFPTEREMIAFHYSDFLSANALATEYSEQLRIDAYASGSDNYVDIVALSARQTMGATSFSGTKENPLLFLKEISSNGNCQTVDVIFPAFPFFLYTNPRWAAYLLEPLLEHQLSGQYPNKYSMHDLGAHFPNLTGHADGRDEYMPVEECGDMLIMGLALVNSLTSGDDDEKQASWSIGRDTYSTEFENDVSLGLESLIIRNNIEYMDNSWGGGTTGLEQARQWLEGRYELWKQWTGYLVEFALEPHNQCKFPPD